MRNTDWNHQNGQNSLNVTEIQNIDRDPGASGSINITTNIYPVTQVPHVNPLVLNSTKRRHVWGLGRLLIAGLLPGDPSLKILARVIKF